MSETLMIISYDELCQIEGIESELIVEIVEYGIVEPIEKVITTTSEDQWFFEASSVYWIKKALRLHADLEIDWIAVAMVIDLMRQKEALKKENELIQRRLTRLTDKNGR